MKKRRIWGPSIAVAISFLCLGSVEGCHVHGEPSGHQVEGEAGTDDGRAVGEAAGKDARGDLDQATGGDLDQATGEGVDIDFTVRAYPVDTERYDAHTDRIYKEAFLKVIIDQAPIRYRHKEGTVTYRELLPDGEGMGDEVFLKAVRRLDFFYQDYDGDGLPELIIDTEGPCVLKYHPEEDQVELYQQKEQGWHLLGAGQMYADLSGLVDIDHHYESVDKGPGCQAFYYQSKRDGYACQVTIDGQAYAVADKGTAEQMDQAYLRMIKDVPHPMSFAALFGNGEDQGYLPGEGQPPCYLLEETAALPINEESGEEWEMYRSMMEGDFSLVEDERWGSLQGHYEDGHIKMWEGSYMSADRGHHTVPLVNGRNLGVERYQDYREWWITRPDPQRWGRYKIREKNYSKGERMSSQELKEGDAGYHKFQDYYHDGTLCGSFMELSPEEWEQIEEMVEGLLIPEEAWKSCSVFTPKEDRPEIPGVS